jgi:multiple antibiotic resistance protein
VEEIPQLTKSALLLFVLLNPFLMSIYLLDLIEELDTRTFNAALARGALIASVAFAVFAIGGDAIFARVLQVRFASFLVFGGILFLLIGVRFVHQGPDAVKQLRGAPEHIAGSIAMPFMIGPGTVSASVLAGARLSLGFALLAIALAMLGTVLGLFVLKWLHDRLRESHGRLVSRYIDVTGRASALLIGTIAIDMVFNGLDIWLTR